MPESYACPYCESTDTYESDLRGGMTRCNGCGEYFDLDAAPEREPDACGAPSTDDMPF